MALPLSIVAITTALNRQAFIIALDHQLAIYDSIYLALAQHFSCPLITIDVKQGGIATAIGVPLKLITDFT
jgi:predicted nucleic acid-binding protein